MDRKIKKIFVITFVTILFYFLLVNIFSPKKDYLFFENRKISNKPSLNRTDILNGSYFENLEDYFVDSFTYRESFLKLATNINLNLIKRPIVNDLYIDKEVILSVWKDWNTPYPKEDIEKMTQGYKNLNNNLKKLNSNFLYVGIPEHSSIFSDKYPSFLYNRGAEWLEIEDDFFKNLSNYKVPYIKARDFLREDIENYYNSTDHHFSYLGAVKTYQEIIDYINLNFSYNLDSNIELVSLPIEFKGSYARKLFFADKYQDQTFIHNDKIEFKRFDNGKEVEAKLFHIDDEQYAGYDIYMGGDIGFTQIETNRNELPNILVYGDSFTNPLETLLVKNSNTFISVDYRYYNEKNISDLVKEYNIDLVICIRDNLMYTNNENNGILK